MKFQYFSYGNDIFENIIDDNKKIYVFDKVSNKNLAKEHYLNSKDTLFKKRPLFLTNSELREFIFLTDKIVLKEEKPVLLFYQALDEEMKKRLKIGNYYDIIDTAENFLGFYRLLNEYQVKSICELEEWQTEIHRDFENIKKKYAKLLEKYSYTIQGEVEKLENLDFSLLEEYDEIVFINKFDFTPLDKKILGKLSKKFGVRICLQILEGDFDEENLSLKKVSCPAKPKNSIRAIKIKERFTQLINFISMLKKDRFEALDGDSESSGYEICKNLLKYKTELQFTETSIFKFLSEWHRILEGAETRKNKLYIRTLDLLEALSSDVFRRYYTIDADAYKEFVTLVSEDYRYVTIEFIEEQSVKKRPLLEKVGRVLEDIEKLNSFKTLEEFVSFLESEESFDFKKLDNWEFDNIIPKYFEALSEVHSIENMGILDSWKDYFAENKTSEGLLRLILKYLRHKTVTPVRLKSTDTSTSIDTVSDASDSNRDKLILLNVYEGIIPSKGKSGFLLTDAQRDKLGILNCEQMKLLEKQNLFRHIFSSNEAIIFTFENEEKNIEVSSFLEELKFNYQIKFEEPKYSEFDCIQAVREIFSSDDYIKSSKDLMADSYSSRKDVLELLHKDFNGSLNLSSYSYSDLVHCRYYFFLKRVSNLQEEILSPEYKIDAKLLGIISHNFMEEVARIKSNEVKKGNFKLDRKKLELVFENQLSKNELKIPVDYLKYYKQIIFPLIIEGVEEFYSILETSFSQEKIKTFSPEKRDKEPILNYSETKLQVNLTGRMDLLLETESENHIYDYKTGKGDISQLDFYSILFYGESNLAQKYIYSILEKKLFEDNGRKNILSKDLLISEIDNFLSDNKYSRTDKSSRCSACEYGQICQMRWENE